MGTGDVLLGGPAMDYHPIQGGVAVLSVASCYRNWVTSSLCGPLAHVQLPSTIRILLITCV